VRAAARLGVDSVFVDVPKPDSRWLCDQDSVTRDGGEQ